MSSQLIILTIILNLIFYLISQKLNIRIFINYIKNFILFSFILFFIAKVLMLNFIFENFLEFFFLYFFIFISLFLSMSVKYIKSPTFLIFESLKNKVKFKDIVMSLEKNDVIKTRILDLKEQNIISIKKDKIYLKKNLGIFINFLFILKKFLNLKSEG